MERSGIGQSNIEFKIQHKGLFIQPDGVGDGPVGGIGVDLTPITREEAGVQILKTDPDFDSVLGIGMAAAQKVLRTKLTNKLAEQGIAIDDLNTIRTIRLKDYEDSSLKRGTIMNKWGEEVGLNKLPDPEMAFLNGSTVENSVIYIQSKMLGAALTVEEIEALKASLPAEPKLRDLKEDDPNDQYKEDEINKYKRDYQVYSDISALGLLKALQDKLPADVK